MSQQVDTAFVKQYHDLIERLLQQMGSRFRGTVRTESQNGEEAFWEQVGSVEAVEVTTRHGDSPMVDTPHARRRVTLRQFDVGDMIDTFDKVKMLIDPASIYVQNFVDALNRKVDDLVIGKSDDSFTVNGGFFGTAYTGKAGTTSTTFTSGNVIAVDYANTGVNSNMTINKLIEARRLLLSYENDPQRESWYIAWSASQLASLLRTTEVTSSDYNTVKALVRGEINTFLGFNFIHSERLLETASASGIRKCPAWTKNGMLLSFGKDITTRVAERPDKRFSWYAYAMLSAGVTRMQENKVLDIRCDEAVL